MVQHEIRGAITQRDIAERLGITVGTVSLALRHDVRISAATRARVTATARELGYNPAQHDIARRLVSRRFGTRVNTKTIALIFRPDFYRTRYEGDIFRGLLEEVARLGYTLVTVYTAEPVDQQNHVYLPPVILRGDIDGLILTQPTELLLPLLALLHGDPNFDDRPVINLIQRTDACSTVFTDDENGFFQASRHLLALGHRHLLRFYFHDDRDIEQRRYAGILRAYAEFGEDPAQCLHRYRLPWGWINPPHNGDVSENEPAFIDFLREHPEITGLLAMNDNNALHCWYALTRAGFTVPEDYSLIGCDDTDVKVDEQGRNLLTSIHLPLEEVGRTAARLAIQRITGEAPDDSALMLPTELAVRESTAPPSH